MDDVEGGSSIACDLGREIGKEHKCDTDKSNFSNLSRGDRNLIIIRSRAKNLPKLYSICGFHLKEYLYGFESRQLKCCDPFMKHKKFIRANLSTVGVSLSKALNDHPDVSKVILPGEKVCVSCKISITSFGLSFHDTEDADEKSETCSPISQNTPEELVQQQLSGSSIEDTEIVKMKINEFLSLLSLPDIHLEKWNDKDKISYIKSKCEEVKAAFVKKFAIALNINESFILPKSVHECVFDAVFEELREKLPSFDKKTQLQALTLAPRSWRREKTAQYFGVTSSMARKAITLRNTIGIMRPPEQKVRTGLKVSDETIKLVTDFYYDENNSRVLPGMKDKVSVVRGKKQEQKRLLLCNLRELFALLLDTYSGIKIGLSSFCALRPRACVLAGASGTHVVCVCFQHQNVDLLMKALNINKSSSELIHSLLCNPASQACMMRLCTVCPTIVEICRRVKLMVREQSLALAEASSTFPNDSPPLNALDDSTEDPFAEASDEDEEVCVKYNEWVSTDRTELVVKEATLPEAFESLSVKIDKLIPHAYISKTQGNFYQDQKKHLNENSAMVVVDFSQNYEFKIQNEAQGYHWNKSASTVHPVLIYYKENGELLSKSLCFLSEDLLHDVAMVVTILDKTVLYIKENMPQIQHIMYFSDGCAAQYKNCQMFLYLCQHFQEHNIRASWTFFATSHGKTAGDGIGGTIKREAARASLQRTGLNQINSVQALYNFCKENIKAVTVFLIEKHEIAAVREIRKNIKATTVPGTRNLHHFERISDFTVGCKRTSEDVSYSVVHDLRPKEARDVEWMPNQYVAVKLHNNDWYIGLITDINKEEKEADIIAMTPSVPSKCYKWPEDQMYTMTVPFPSLVCSLDYVEKNDCLYPQNLRRLKSLVHKHKIV